MTLDDLRQLLLNHPDAVEETPFGPEALVYKVHDKMFGLVAWQATPLSVTLKCDPVDAEALRVQFAAVTAGYHMNKRHWNTIVLDGSMPDDLLARLIRESYILVVKGLPKAQRAILLDRIE